MGSSVMNEYKLHKYFAKIYNILYLKFVLFIKKILFLFSAIFLNYFTKYTQK